MSVLILQKELEDRFQGISVKTVRDSLLIEPKDLPQVVRFIKESPVHRIDYLSSITAVDYLTYLEAVYHFFSMEKKAGPLALRVRVSKEAPLIPSLVPLFKSAELQEREAYDLFGIRFEGHPDLRRIMMWEGFEHHPMRKDYEQEDSDILDSSDIEWLEAHNVRIPAEIKKKAEELKAAGKKTIVEKPAEPRPA